MSHISKIELVIHSLEDLKDACRQLGFEFIKNQKTFKWYGRWVGDTPLPEGIKIEDLGKCDHAIRVPGCDYEVGIVKRGDHYILLWDYYSVGGLEVKIGPNAGKIKQAYTVARVRKEARRKGYRVLEKKIDQSIRLVLTA
jgi:hypothetical protein